MIKSKLLKIIAGLSIVFAVSHKIALELSLYFTSWWTDIVMHAFGGVIGALFVIYITTAIGIAPQRTSRKILLALFVIMSVIAVGAIWELWEIFVGFTDPFTDIFDTILDLIMDTIGAIIGFIYYEKRIRTKSE